MTGDAYILVIRGNVFGSLDGVTKVTLDAEDIERQKSMMATFKERLSVLAGGRLLTLNGRLEEGDAHSL
jgi:hypothetical protein